MVIATADGVTLDTSRPQQREKEGVTTIHQSQDNLRGGGRGEGEGGGERGRERGRERERREGANSNITYSTIPIHLYLRIEIEPLECVNCVRIFS